MRLACCESVTNASVANAAVLAAAADDDSAVNDIRSGSSRLLPDRKLRGGTLGGGASDPLLAEFGKLLEAYVVDELPFEPGRGRCMANVLYAETKSTTDKKINNNFDLNWQIRIGIRARVNVHVDLRILVAVDTSDIDEYCNLLRRN